MKPEEVAVGEAQGPAAEEKPAEEVSAEAQKPEGLISEVKAEAEKVGEEVEHFVDEVEAAAARELNQMKPSEIFGAIRSMTGGHGSHNAAVGGLQTDADPNYIHPGQLPKE